ncbi:uncharacterized protein [Chanodichthys erythropterus]|uniref:uncharacterized protein isoform X2 n=1 Tax=Chanodichthys erythropterus TaxID=933992 RepID=UPI00351E642B
MVRAFVLFFLCLWRLVDVKAEVKSVSVMEGDSVTLNTDVTEVQKYSWIKWTFGSTRIAQINRLTQTNSTYDGPDKRFKDRLKLDQTGSLTITNTRTTDSGVYNLSLTRGETKYKSFNVQVNVTPQTSPSPEGTSSSNCVLSSSTVNKSTFNPNEDAITVPADQGLSSFYIVLLSAAASGSLLIVTAIVIFWICWKHRKTDQEDKACDEEITYADPTFYKRKAQKSDSQPHSQNICAV